MLCLSPSYLLIIKITKMEIRVSERKKAKIKLAVQGTAGSGKTYSSLLIAKGLIGGNLSKTAIIDTENRSADLYAHLGSYNVVSMDPPYSPERYIEAIELCELIVFPIAGTTYWMCIVICLAIVLPTGVR